MKKAFLLLAVATGFMVACTDNAHETAAGEQKTGDTTAAVTENKQERNKKIIMASMDGIASRNVDQMLQDATPGPD